MIWRQVKDALGNAFAVSPREAQWLPEELALMERIAQKLVERRMATPAILFLESLGPLNFLGSQALYALTPLLGLVCNQVELERAARILERRDSLATFIQLLERRDRGREG